MKTRLQNLWMSLRSSYWFIPMIMLLLATGLSLATQQLDDMFRGDVVGLLPGIFQGGPDGARSMLATIAGSMITAATVTFSITIAALATASSQFGPRLLRIFMQDTGSQVVLGTMLGTFLYCILSLRLVPANGSSAEAPHISTTIALALAVASIGVLIYFIHHMASMLQVSNVVARVGEELINAVARLFPEQIGQERDGSTTPDAVPISDHAVTILPDTNQHAILAERIGYVQAIDDEHLIRLAIDNDVMIRIALQPGEFMVPEAQLGVVWPGDRVTQTLEAEIQNVFLVGGQRTPQQDIALYFDELIEVALRALSPGINDPYTALTCIDWLTSALASMARRQLPSRYRYDENGTLRIIADSPELEQLIARSYDQIRDAGRDNARVLLKLLDSLQVVGAFVGEQGRAALRSQTTAIYRIVRRGEFSDQESAALNALCKEVMQDLNSTD